MLLRTYHIINDAFGIKYEQMTRSQNKLSVCCVEITGTNWMQSTKSDMMTQDRQPINLQGNWGLDIIYTSHSYGIMCLFLPVLKKQGTQTLKICSLKVSENKCYH